MEADNISNEELDSLLDDAGITPFNDEEAPKPTSEPASSKAADKTIPEVVKPDKITETAVTEDATVFTNLATNLLIEHFKLDPKAIPEDFAINSHEELGTMLKDYMEEIVEEAKASAYVDPRLAELNEYVKRGGVLEEGFKYFLNTFDPSRATVDTEENQSRVLREFYRTQKQLDDESINTLIDKHKADGKLEGISQEALQRLQRIQLDNTKAAEERSKQEQAAQYQQEAASLELLKNTVFKGTAEDLGADLSDKDRTSFWSFLNDPKPEYGNKTAREHRLANTPNYALKAEIALWRGDLDVKTKQAVALKDASKAISESLRRQQGAITNNSNNVHTKSEDPGGFADMLDNIDITQVNVAPKKR